MFQLRLSFASHLQFATHLPLNPTKVETKWRRRPKEKWERFPTLLATSNRLSKHPKVFLYHQKWGMVHTLTRNKIKNPFFTCQRRHRSTLSQQRSALSQQCSTLSQQCSAPDFTNWIVLSPLSTTQSCGTHPQFSIAQPWAVWQHYVFEALGVIPMTPDVGICFKIKFFLLNHAPLSSCLFSSTTNVSY